MSHLLVVTGIPLDQKLFGALSRVRALGHRLHLLADKDFDTPEGLFDSSIFCDLRKTKEVLSRLKRQSVQFDAVTLQFSDWLTPLVALIAREYGCIGNDPLTAFNCRSKYHMRKKLREAGVPGPAFRLCRNFDELQSGIREIGFPCVAKPVGANGSYGVFAVMNEAGMTRLKSDYESSVAFLNQRYKEGDVFNFSPEELEMIGAEDPVNMATDYLIEEYMMGPEISVDAIVQNGQITIMGIEEQIRMKPPYFIQLAAKLPYQASAQRMGEIEKLVSDTIHAMEIRNSATHTEIIFTDEGPKIVEIGCRFGGDDLHDTIQEVTGYSMMFESAMVALGVRREYLVRTRCHTAMQYILPPKAGTIRDISIAPGLKENPDVTEVFLYAKKGDAVAPPPSCFDYLGYVSVKGKNGADAQKNLESAISQIKFHISHD